MTAAATFTPRLARRRRRGRIIVAAFVVMTVTVLTVLVVLLASVAFAGRHRLTPSLVTNMPSVLSPETAGMKSAIWGSLWIVALTALFAIPIGVGAAVYLHEYARDNRLTRLIRLNITNLAGVPSIIYGILGLALFVRWLRFDRSVISGAATMSLLILPVIIIAAREALLAVPDSIRHAAYALGATRWQAVRHHVLPGAMPGIMTGVILALSRAIGETAPLIVLGALTYVAFTPGGSLVDDYPHTAAGAWDWFTTALGDAFTAMPIQIFDWAGRPQPVFHELAAACIVVLLVILIILNAAAIAVRAWFQRTVT